MMTLIFSSVGSAQCLGINYTKMPPVKHNLPGVERSHLLFPNLSYFNMASGNRSCISLMHLMKVKEECEKVDLKLNIQKTKIMASGPITSWQINGEIRETMRDFIFLGSKITAHGDCSHEIERCLLLGRKAMTNLDNILKAETLLCQQRSIQSKLWFFQWSCMDVRFGL